ncbi:hypothetical protein [Levilactobacillus namurensis]|uniref:Uncharacterized protein n=1 Tax=Levilactobacillus namurensis TaxID=380393 RepID=A0AAW8W8B9_9LACO|nr:hypothetical protein [Levilactobacillus namurensis]MCW3778166.1 hypothetical protein [Levilactobacillus namurensis]MDT7014979.1 hypothetical protein [Levilactobacillus namurensis]MDT7018076.1 hypothetical protein [Levilactobacillus namurensis]WNN64933.1 hypothetical protein RIN67_09535 [Levilactobacillus namurensis]
MSKKRMSDEEAKRWRKIVFMDDDQGEKRPERRAHSYVYGEGTQSSSWWQRLKRRLSRR